jgi:hypothetical protein
MTEPDRSVARVRKTTNAAKMIKLSIWRMGKVSKGKVLGFRRMGKVSERRFLGLWRRGKVSARSWRGVGDIGEGRKTMFGALGMICG